MGLALPPHPAEYDPATVASLPGDAAQDRAIATSQQELATFGRQFAAAYARPAETQVFDEDAHGPVHRYGGTVNADRLPLDPPSAAGTIDSLAETRHFLMLPATSFDAANNCTVAREVQLPCCSCSVTGRSSRAAR